jgi:hypothetical protein
MSIVRILGMGANPLNSRDGIIVEGCKSILNIAAFDRYIFIDDHKLQQTVDFYPDEKFDLIVYCGTPWLWDGMEYTAKYVNTLAVRDAHPEAKMVWLGIGSSLYLNDENSTILRTTNDQKMLRETFKNDLVFVRDSLAHDILHQAGVNHHYVMCPSYFFNPVCETTREYDVIFYHAPKTGISCDYWDEQKLREYNNIYAYFSTEVELKVAVCEKEEVEIVRKLFGRNPILLKDPIDTFNICKKARKVLSGRIHNAVPALVYGAEVGIVPVDSRHRVLTDFFDIKVENVADLSKIKKCDINALRNGNIDFYRNTIKGYLK